MSDNTPARIDELRDGYALGLLEGEELAEMRALLESPGPRENLAANAIRVSEQAVALLASSAPPVPPPSDLRQRILAAIEQDARASLPLSMPAPSGVRGPTRLVGRLGWAAAAGLAGVALMMNSRIRDTQQDLAVLERQAGELRRQLVQRDRVLSVIGAGDSRSIRLVNTAPQSPQYRAYWSASAGLVLAGNGIAHPLPGRTLQLWIVPKQGVPISAGVFSPSSTGEVLLIAASIAAPDSAQALAISDEPTGGSPQPTTQPAWIGGVGSGF
jgi:anti-sigma-K factor RskA